MIGFHWQKINETLAFVKPYRRMDEFDGVSMLLPGYVNARTEVVLPEA
jgi:hypothetical protein